eukprot:TRINITY_DN26987_c0_g1_i1.p1 TRINITY_DN26987_c0_g1~~TRINITY_DN26987_c0_g1_i1.p1  ORF type:complete len:407 (+),score=102.19 TRINITY_DN26987_c0_g1_i1:108-1328(+)
MEPTTENAPVIPVVPAYCTSGVLAFLKHLWLAVLHFFGLGSSDPTNWSVRRPGNKVIGQSCRGLFAIVWNNRVKPSARVLISPFHHHSFMRMMRKTGQELVVMRADGAKLFAPKDFTAKDFDAVVITHMLGRDYQCDWLLEWKKQNPDMLIIEDRVQGGLLSDATPGLSDVQLYSLGQDKIPNAMGGGYAIVPKDTELYEMMVNEVEKMPFESNWERLSFLLKKIPTIAIYNNRLCCYAAERLSALAGFTRNEITDTYRKKNPGFMHGGYMIRPSPALVQSIDTIASLSQWEEMQKACTVKYQTFLKHVPEHLRQSVQVCKSNVSCCYFFIRLPDLLQSREHMASKGIFTINNQTYLPADPNYAHDLEGMCTLPTFLALKDEELKYVAETVSDCWTRYGSDKVKVM